jgi:hypothetical protein
VFWEKVVVTRVAFGVPLLQAVVRLKDVTELKPEERAVLASFEVVSARRDRMRVAASVAATRPPRG